VTFVVGLDGVGCGRCDGETSHGILQFEKAQDARLCNYPYFV
jgi:hypothetical protein